MTVYVVTKTYFDGDSTYVHGVYSTLQRAEEEKRLIDADEVAEADIESFTVDE